MRNTLEKRLDDDVIVARAINNNIYVFWSVVVVFRLDHIVFFAQEYRSSI